MEEVQKMILRVDPTPLEANKIKIMQKNNFISSIHRTKTATRKDIDDLATLRGELEDVRVRWKDIGIHLGIRIVDLEVIEKEVSVSMEQLTKMLTIWLNLNYNFTRHGKPSWRKLVEVVAQSCGGKNPLLAMKIAEKYEVPPASPGEEQGLDSNVTDKRKNLSKQGAVAEDDPSDGAEKFHEDGIPEVQCDTQSIASAKSEDLQAIQKQQELQFSLLFQVAAQVHELVGQSKSGEGESEVQRLTEARGSVVSTGHGITLSCEQMESAPCGMSRGTCAADDRTVYVKPFDTRAVYACDLQLGEWSPPRPPILPECPYGSPALAIVQGLLTTIGGHLNYHATNILNCLVEEGGERRWTAERFPPMPTKRWNVAALCSENYLVVAGGTGGVNTSYRRDQFGLDAVEIMDIDKCQWFIACRLPRLLYRASLTICNDTVYLLGALEYGYESKQRNKLVFSCSLNSLITSLRPPSFTARVKSVLSGRKVEGWQEVVNVPLFDSTCASLQGRLLAVGGEQLDERKTDAIYMYNPEANSWEVISHMAVPRSMCLVVNLPGNKLMVIGGRKDIESELEAHSYNESDMVEMACWAM